MSDPESQIDEQAFQEFQTLVQQIESAETDNFFELAKLLGRNPKTDFAGADLSGTDLSFGDLSGANLSGTDLSNANLSGTDLSGANLSNADLSGADLSNATLKESNLLGSNLVGANLTGADLTRITRDKATLEDAILEGATLSEQTLVVRLGDGTVVISNFGRISKDYTPDSLVLTDIDTLKFSGAGLTASSMSLAQKGQDLIITFDHTDNVQVILNNLNLDDLNPLPTEARAEFMPGKVIFETFDDLTTFDIFNTESSMKQPLSPPTTTLLNSFDYALQNSESSDDVINGMADGEALQGLGGNKELRGGDEALIGGTGADIFIWGGDEALIGGTGADIFVLSSEAGTAIIQDFNLQEDILQLPLGLSISQIAVAVQGEDGTAKIIVKDTGELLALIINFQVVDSESSYSSIPFSILSRIIGPSTSLNRNIS